jgi:hypothetical protein
MAAIPLNGFGSMDVTRNAVFSIAAAARTPIQCEQAMVAAAAFGAGSGRLVARVQRPWAGLVGPAPPVIGTALAAAAAILFAPGGGAVSAYAFLRNGPRHIKFIGPSFFSKFLYFVGYGQPHPGPEPLIIDRFVAKGLNKLIGATGPFTPWTIHLPHWDWTPAQYGAYIDWAATEKIGPGPITSEDEAEFRIWQHGKV